MSWFEVDKEGLSKLLQKHGKVFILHELIQNAWDENIQKVEVKLTPVPNKRLYKLEVSDDSPEGWSDLSHAYTLFAESKKKGNPNKRGLFNLGEKLVLALCEEASIVTTKGTVTFGSNGQRNKSRSKIAEGSVLTAYVKMTKAEFDEVSREIKKILPPEGVKTYYNGELLESKKPLRVFEEALPTVISDEEGNLKRTSRKTQIEVYKADGVAMIYEMGIPVVETGDKYHVNVMQKVPINMQRDNVPPSYLKSVRVYVANKTADLMSESDATSTWIKEATSDSRCSDETMGQMLDLRFGEDRVSYDPSDAEANHLAVAKGYTLVSGGTLSKDQWDNAKDFGLMSSSGSVFPTPKPYQEGGRLEKLIPPEDWTTEQKQTVEMFERLSRVLIGSNVSYRIANEPRAHWVANYGGRRMCLNHGRLGKRWWSGPLADKLDLMVHELGHEYESNHLSSKYNDALTKLAGKLAVLALEKPELFK
jgi:hypothetical protein